MLDVREENLDVNLDELSPIQQFIFQYGRFIIEWNDFNLLLDVLIWHLRTEVFSEKTSYSTFYREINSMQMPQKKAEVIHWLRRANKENVIQSVNKVFDVADRNKWVHGVLVDMMSLGGGLLRFTPKNSERRYPDISEVRYDTMPVAFEEANEVLDQFYTSVMEEFKIDGNTCFEYLLDVRGARKEVEHE